MANFPEKIFKSLDFTSLPEKSLIQLIKRDDLQMKKVEVWEYILKWGLAPNPTLLPDPNIWSMMILKQWKHCLSLIRFFSLSSKDFLQKITSTISKWIDKIVIIINSKFDHLRELYLPYKFQLLLRGSRDGFTTKKFHELCDGKNNNITFIKNNNANNAIISCIVNTDNALFYNRHHGPNFGRDTITICSQNDEFTIVIMEKDYEVFQIKKDKYTISDESKRSASLTSGIKMILKIFLPKELGNIQQIQLSNGHIWGHNDNFSKILYLTK
ncbi:hypothetical protein RhiirA5_426825 [Rhizophagus irregularis]|uniref:BACK domain-containing protein n=1 Tax=Rhizophagus irregularis TaxID=588596 RepID=A0A2N0P3G5_9GLOM|nr:hypothetical protein RhiirA5_426825 [Rhizophagus irregularis]